MAFPGDAGGVMPPRAPFSFFAMAEIEQKPKRGRPAGAVQRLSVQEVATLLSKPEQTIYTWTRQLTAEGKRVLPTHKYGRGPGSVRIFMTDVEALPERLKMRVTNPTAVEHFERLSTARKQRRDARMVFTSENLPAMSVVVKESRNSVLANTQEVKTDLQSVNQNAVLLGKTGSVHSARRNTDGVANDGTETPRVANRGGGESLVTRTGYIHIHSSAQNFIPMEDAPS